METNTIKKYPKKLLDPIDDFLRSQLKFLKTKRRNIEKEDPFRDLSRTVDIAVDGKAETQFGHDRSVAISEQLDKKILQIKRALTRIKRGQYGFCATCGNLINTDRLAIYPEATNCIQCETKKEK